MKLLLKDQMASGGYFRVHSYTQIYTYTWVTAPSIAVIHPHMHTAQTREKKHIDLSGMCWWLRMVLIMFDGNVNTDFHKHGPSHTHPVSANVHRHQHSVQRSNLITHRQRKSLSHIKDMMWSIMWNLFPSEILKHQMDKQLNLTEKALCLRVLLKYMQAACEGCI